MLNIVLVEPEIPQNCGNIARTCAATGSRLHLIRPLGFDISDRAVKRAGLDYWHLVEVSDYENLDAFFAQHPEAAADCWLTTTKAPRSYQEARFSPDCWLFFGKETAGLPLDLRERFRERCIRLPMIDVARSLNLSNTVAVDLRDGPGDNDAHGIGLETALGNLERKKERILRYGAPSEYPSADMSKPYTGAKSVNDALADCLELAEVMREIQITRDKVEEIDGVLAQMDEDDARILRLWYIERKSKDEITEAVS